MNFARTLKVVRGAITSQSFLDGVRRQRWYHAVLLAKRQLPTPCRVRVIRADGPVEVVAFTTTIPRRVLARAGDGGTPVPLDADMLEDPGIIDQWAEETT